MGYSEESAAREKMELKLIDGPRRTVGQVAVADILTPFAPLCPNPAISGSGAEPNAKGIQRLYQGEIIFGAMYG